MKSGHHRPLSADLSHILMEEMADTPLTLNSLMERTEGRGVYLVMILLCLPFIQPIPLPGVSTVLGAVIVLLAISRARDSAARLPKFIGDRAFPPNSGAKILGGSIKFLRFLERWVKPRGDAWISWRGVRIFNCILIIFLSGLLALPIPLPGTNQLPAISIVLIALSMMEEDGILVFYAYGASFLTTAAFAVLLTLIALIGVGGVRALVQKFFSGEP